MAQTVIAQSTTTGQSAVPSGYTALNSPRAIKRWSAVLAEDVNRKSYFTSKFMGKGEDTTRPIMMLTDLEADNGEEIMFDLSIQLRQLPIEGDNVQEGTEEDLTFYSDSVFINQMRGGVNTGGRMSRKRTLHDLRKIARKKQSDWWARIFDELFFIYLAGKSSTTANNINRLTNSDYILTDYTGFAGNGINAPDSSHVIYGGSATSAATLSSSMDMSLDIIDKAVVAAGTIGGSGATEGLVEMQPVNEAGADFVAVIHPYQTYALRKDINPGQWLDIQKALATAIGEKSPIVKGGIGMHNKVVIQENKAVPTFTSTASGSSVTGATALLLGAQAGKLAFGTSGTGLRYGWHEETRDNGNQVVISTYSIFGLGKTRFNGYDYGVMALHTAVDDPNS